MPVASLPTATQEDAVTITHEQDRKALQKKTDEAYIQQLSRQLKPINETEEKQENKQQQEKLSNSAKELTDNSSTTNQQEQPKGYWQRTKTWAKEHQKLMVAGVVGVCFVVVVYTKN